MKLCFDSIEETKEFVKSLKGTRGGKSGDADDGVATGGQPGNVAPPPLSPPVGGAAFNPGGFAPPAGFPTGPAPEVVALVNRIATGIDRAIAQGQPADQVLSWFRGRCGSEAAQATMEQIKTVFLPKVAMPVLEETAKLINA